ncbi:FtsQ-type POTRA domain-containing protein [Candidatus Parcubacteria bacterium]|nr:FtsQ-type POTRA domain-containing protein [Candidatus Parcubacteria bacterium]
MKLVGSREAVRSPELHKKKERVKKARYALYAILIAIFIVGPVFTLRSKSLQIRSVSLEGNQVTKEDDIRRIVTESLDGKYLWIIPKSSSLLFQRSTIERGLLAALPRLASADASLSDTKTLRVAVTERTPYALYCSDISNAENPAECFFLDETGYIFSEAPDFSGGVYMVYAADPPFDPPLRRRFLPDQSFKNLDKFARDLVKLRLEPLVVVRKHDEYDALLRSGPVLKWKSGQDLEHLALDLEAFLNESKMKAGDISKLQYLDLRFDNKVFYR